MTTFEELWAAEQERRALAPWKQRVAAAGFTPVEEPWTYVPAPKPLPPPAVKPPRGVTPR